MKIGPTSKPVLLTGKTQKKQQEFQEKKITEQKKDTVEISQSGREKLKNIADSCHQKVRYNDEIIEQISAKTARIRNKVEAGYYDLEGIQNKIIDKLADTIIDEIDNNTKME